MPRVRSMVLAPALAAVLLPLPGAAQPAPECAGVKPYVFVLFDTSGSMNLSPPCTQSQFDRWDCSFLCPTGNCFVPSNGDDPNSKFFQMKEALFTALSFNPDIHFGFATFNQDELQVESKHWIYRATSNGPFIPGWGPFPALNSQEVMGRTWTCNTGSGDQAVGCAGTTPADLVDAWELARVQRLPKGGARFNQAVTVFVRHAGVVYRARYLPLSGTLGSATIQMAVNVVRCLNPNCTSTSAISQTTISWQRVGDSFLSWESAAVQRSNPELSYFPQSVANDSSATNTCAGWDPNTDTAADDFNNYNLRWLTGSSDPRGPFFTRGDVIPLDWLDDNQAEIRNRLAPNLTSNPWAVPDFRVAPYFNDFPSGLETFLRLRNELIRPLIANGSTPHAAALESFRTWYQSCVDGVCSPTFGWSGVADLEDPDWLCRRKYLLVLTDGEENCQGGGGACATAEMLSNQNVPVFVMAFGAQTTPSSTLECMAFNGGTLSPIYPQTQQELIRALNDLFTVLANP